MHRWIAPWALAFFCATSQASMQSIPPSPTHEWSDVLDIERRAVQSGTLGYASDSERWLLTPEGRVAMVMNVEDADEPGWASLGRYRFEGAWLTFEQEGHALDLSKLPAARRAEIEAWSVEVEAAAAAAAEAEAVPSEAQADGREAFDEGAAQVDAASEATEPHTYRARFLRVPWRGGELLVREAFIPMAANGWQPGEPLELYVEVWRLPKGVELPEDGSRISIEDPLHAGLPHELTRMLRAEPAVATVAQVVESADALEWHHQTAEVHLRLDVGELAGLYAGMTMRGLPPDEGLYGEIVASGRDSASLKVELERFSPRDTPAMPLPGMRFTTRPAKGACPIDTSAAVRGKVTSVATPAELVQWDEEGYAWFELQIDQGAAQGLMVGDEVSAESDEIDGEGRVLAVASNRATVLWRATRYDEDAVPLPTRGEALVTPAWRRAEYDTFGGTGLD